MSKIELSAQATRLTLLSSLQFLSAKCRDIPRPPLSPHLTLSISSVLSNSHGQCAGCLGYPLHWPETTTAAAAVVPLLLPQGPSTPSYCCCPLLLPALLLPPPLPFSSSVPRVMKQKFDGCSTIKAFCCIGITDMEFLQSFSHCNRQGKALSTWQILISYGSNEVMWML